MFTAAERLRIARAIKWVDEVYENAPLTTCVETIDKYNCDFCVHGDDLSINAQGVDTFATVKAAGRYREVKRTGFSMILTIFDYLFSWRLYNGLGRAYVACN